MINLRQNKGFALAFSLIFLLLIVSFMAVYILAVANGVSQANRLANEKRAYYVADAGLADAYERITQAGITVLPSSTPGNPFIPAATTDNGIYQIGGTSGSYSVNINYSNNPRSNYTVVSTGTYGNITKTLQLKIIGASISKYAYWSQTEINPQYGILWWVGEPGLQMLTTGPVQTNGQLNIFGNPIFNGLVTEGASSPDYYPGVESDPSIIFPQGLTNNSPNVDLPPQQTLNSIQAVANDGQGLLLTGASTVVFNSTGTITVTGVTKNSQGQVTQTFNNTTMNAPANGVIYVQSNTGQQDGNATVQGTVSGQLTVAADQNIYISGNVSYNQDPRIFPSSTDMVGLVANQNITVIEADATNPANNPGQPGLELSAVMVALQGSFQVDNWWTYIGNSQQAVMDQFGSLINYVCGVTGEMDWSGNLLGGYNQVQSYDNRLQTLAPPGFPPYVNNAGDGVYNKISITEL